MALCARERLLTAMNQLVTFQVAGIIGGVVALVAVVFFLQIGQILVEIFCHFNRSLLHVLVVSQRYHSKV